MTVESQKKLKNEELTKDEKENVSEKKPKEEETELVKIHYYQLCYL